MNGKRLKSESFERLCHESNPNRTLNVDAVFIKKILALLLCELAGHFAYIYYANTETLFAVPFAVFIWPRPPRRESCWATMEN